MIGIRTEKEIGLKLNELVVYTGCFDSMCNSFGVLPSYIFVVVVPVAT